MIFVPIFFAVFLWLGGYLITTRFMSTSGVNSDNDEKIITPPKWLYYICGAPVSKKYPKGDMRVYAFQSQILGVFIGLYMIWYVITRPPTFVNLIGLGFCVLISYLVTAYVSKRFPSKNQAAIRKGKNR